MLRHVTALAISTLLAWVLVGSVDASAGRVRGLGYRTALEVRREAAARPTRRPVAPGPSAAERRAVARWGRAVGRWWDECDRYWPRAQLQNCMYCIKYESGGNPRAYNSYSGATGLFQLVGHKCNVWPPETNIRLAHKLWLSRGWQPWVVM